jgi:hypothetical protein
VIPLTEWTRAPLGVVLLALLAALLLFWLLHAWIRAGRGGRPRWLRLVDAGARLVSSAAWLLVAFVLCWGAGYRRQAIEARLGLETDGLEADDWSRLDDEVAERFLGCIHDALAMDAAPADASGPTAGGDAREAAIASVRAAIARTVLEWDGAEPRLPARVKRLPAGSLLRFGSSGVTLPWTLEACVDGALPEVAEIAVAAHELAHVAGANGEAEAELLAAAAGLRAESALSRYAVALEALSRTIGEQPAEKRQRIERRLPARAREDLEAYRAVAARYHSPRLSAPQRVLYDAYLRSQGVQAGVRDYSRAARLFAMAHRQGLLFPERSSR